MFTLPLRPAQAAVADTAAAAGYQFTEREALHYLIRLDRLGVIELQPGNRVRLLVSRHFSWRPGGPVQKHIHAVLMPFF